ncbi:MAG: hypothetical protein LBD23_04735 [Oscillospiraceae bacterium]|nr:hypothetical protein [Oscillospiraceae bacterium]
MSSKMYFKVYQSTIYCYFKTGDGSGPLKKISFVILRTVAESITSVFATLAGFCDFAQNDGVGTFSAVSDGSLS